VRKVETSTRRLPNPVLQADARGRRGPSEAQGRARLTLCRYAAARGVCGMLSYY
jgi:hypothetical protein